MNSTNPPYNPDRYGPKDVKQISMHVGTRNPTQVRTHAQKYYLRLVRIRYLMLSPQQNLPIALPSGTRETTKGGESGK